MDIEKKEEKKRGRKPKSKEDIINNNTKTSPKKRGRKPKPKVEEDTKPKVTRKRGRKPKEKVYSVTKQIPITSETNDENVILRLDVTKTDLENLRNESIFNPQNNHEPKPYEPDTNFQYINALHKNNDKNYDINYNKQYDPNYDQNGNNKSKNNWEDLAQIDDGTEKRLIKRNLLNIMYEFIDGNNRKEWPKNTNIYCMWCSHPFDTLPIALPEKLVKDKFYLSGCFCSFNCAASYNFNQNTYNIWERYSLLNLLYKKIYNTKPIKIKLAPPRETLKIFGGFMTIEEFRKNFLTNNSYSVITPPMISLVPRIEENIFEPINTNSLFVPLDENMVQDVSLKLKREKPLTDPKKTLESYMDLKIL